MCAHIINGEENRPTAKTGEVGERTREIGTVMCR